MPNLIAFCHRVALHFRRKRCYRLINGKLAGTDRFEKKRKLLNSIGHDIGEGTKIVGPIFLTATLKTGDGCWICQRALLAHGADIPDGCVVAAGAVVIGNKNFEPDTLIGGVPAKTTKHYEDGERGA